MRILPVLLLLALALGVVNNRGRADGLKAGRRGGKELRDAKVGAVVRDPEADHNAVVPLDVQEQGVALDLEQAAPGESGRQFTRLSRVDKELARNVVAVNCADKETVREDNSLGGLERRRDGEVAGSVINLDRVYVELCDLERG
jgi:hypothetical protein